MTMIMVMTVESVIRVMGDGWRMEAKALDSFEQTLG